MADEMNKEREASEQWLRDRYGAYRGHFAWRELEEAFLAGRASLAASAGSEPVAWRVRRHDAPNYWIIFLHRPVDAMADPEREVQPLYTHPSPPEGAGWISVDERLPELYKRVMVLTTDCEDDPCAALAHYNGPEKFLGVGGHRLNPVTHWQEIEAPPAGWKLPPAKPRVSHRRKPALPASEAKEL